jgi:hypothetical protein
LSIILPADFRKHERRDKQKKDGEPIAVLRLENNVDFRKSIGQLNGVDLPSTPKSSLQFLAAVNFLPYHKLLPSHMAT